MNRQVILPDGTEITLTISEPQISNVVTVSYLEEKVINTSSVFKYIPIEHIAEANGKTYTKNIPTFERYNCISGARYGNLSRGLRKAKKQMEQICSMDVSLDDENEEYKKSVHCKLAGDTCHVTGAKSFEQGMRATRIIIDKVQTTQKLIDEYRLGKRDKETFYELYKGESTPEKIDLLCEDMLEKSEMLCVRSIIVAKSVTSNCVFEISANFKFFLKTLCEVAHYQEGFCVDYANWTRSTIAAIAIPDTIGDRKFYHRAQINSKGAIRLSSPCDIADARNGYFKLCKFLFKVWDQTYKNYEKNYIKIQDKESKSRDCIEKEFDNFWKDFSVTTACAISGELELEMYDTAKAIYDKLGVLI